jgi:hypothetical protein
MGMLKSTLKCKVKKYYLKIKILFQESENEKFIKRKDNNLTTLSEN